MQKKQPTHPELIAEIDAACDASGISRRTFSVMATNDAGFYTSLTYGRELRRATLGRVRATLDEIATWGDNPRDGHY